MATLAVNQLPLAPLGAGDLIDRAVRLYRRHFLTLIRIAAPPALITAVGGVMVSVSWRELQATGSESFLALYILLLIAGLALWLGGVTLNVIVMGGATRNLITHLLWDEPVTARATYANARSRFWGLLAATLIVGVIIFITTFILFYVWLMAVSLVVLGCFLLPLPPWGIAIIGVIAGLVVTLGVLWLYFLIVGRFAYVPQVMLVEGKGVFQAIGRSMTLASGNIKRLMAMTLFSIFAAYSALMILIVPLGWYGYLNGIDPFSMSAQAWPAWYAISYEVLAQLSSILLAPVWMLGLSLLYVDERVRHEGYDIEMLAARRLGEVPRLYGGQAAPLAPALAHGGGAPQSAPAMHAAPQPYNPRPGAGRTPGSTLGLS